MARIKKYSPEQNLSSFGTFVIDNNPNSDYFRITEFNDTFTGGKNGFLIEGSQYLQPSTEIKIEILDVNGDPIYYEPGNGIPEYYEGISKLIAVYIYEDTPIGLGKVTVLGELNQYVDNGVTRDIPAEWKGAYNVKWERTFQVNKNLANEDRVRFYRRPQVEITEINKPIFNNNSLAITKTGTINGVPLIPTENAKLTGFSLPTSYRLNIASGDNWTGSVVGQTITVDSLNYSSIIDDIVSDTEIIVTTPYSQNGIVKSFTNQNYSVTFNYLEGISDLATALTGSFAKINITDMKTFVGDAARVKVFRRSQSNLTDYEFVQDLQLESNELLRDIETVTATEEYYGNLTDVRLDNYWLTSSNAVSVEFNRDFLFNSAKINSNAGTYFYTTESLSIQQGVEYTLNLNARKSQNTTGDFIKVFLSGSLNGTPTSQTITTIDSSTSVLQKVNLSENIIANDFDNARLYFEVEGSDWYISDISFKASQETSFSPDEITFVQTVPKTLQKETFDYRFEFYDINNNYIPVAVEKTKTFDGGNLNLYNKSLTITPNQLYFAFDSASAPANPLPPTTIIFNIETSVITGSITYTSGAYDEFGDYILPSEYIGGRYPGLLNDINTLTPTLNVSNFTGSRNDITVQYIRFTGEVEGVTDEVVITRVADGKGGVNFEIRPYRGTFIKNSSDNDLELQAIRIDGTNEIILKNGLPQIGFSDAKLRVLSSSLTPLGQPTSSYYLLSEASSSGFIRGLKAGTTGSGQINYNATFNRDSIDGELTVFLMDGPTQNDILTSIILTDLQDGLASGFVPVDTEQFGIKSRTEREFSPNIGRVTGSFYLRGTNEAPISGTLNIYPSMSVDPETIEPYYYMFYVTGTFDRRISVEVTDFNNNIINSGIPGQNGIPFFEAVQTKQLSTKFTYVEDYTSASISVDKTFVSVPDGDPGDDAIVVKINPTPITLNADQRGRVFSYETAATDITVTQGFLPLIFTSSKKPGTFTTASIITKGIQYSTFDEIMGDASMSISGFSNMTDLTASVEYRLEIHPFYTASYYTQSFFQQFQKSVDGAAAINIELTPTILALSADENGGVYNYTPTNTTLKVKQGNEYLEFNSNNLPGTFTASISATNISVGLLTASKTQTTDNGLNDTLLFVSMSNMTDDSASIDYSILVRPFSITNGIATGSQYITGSQTFTKQKEGVNARSVSLAASSLVVNFDGDGVVTSPLDSIFLTATAFNVTASQTYYQYFKDGFAYSTIGTDTVFEIGSGDATSPGENATWQVQIRDGNTTSGVIATSEVTITGIKAGADNYQVSLTNGATAVLVETDGSTTLTETGTQIRAFKGTTELTHVTTYSEETLDLIGNVIGTLGEFSASLYSKPGFITQTNIPIGNPATVAPIQNWDNPQDNKAGTIVYKVDIENGRATYFLSQSLSTVFQGATGPGVVFRGEWSGSTDYLFDLNQKRRDAVLFDKNSDGTPEMYYASKLPSGPHTYVSNTILDLYTQSIDTAPAGYTLIGPKQPNTETNYWEELGEEDFFVAAKIGIFEESFVKNTINVGSPATSYDVNPQITIFGGNSEPYISIGQSIQGYGQKGVYIGVTEDGGPTGTAGTTGLLSIENSDGTKHLRWDGNELNVSGIISASEGRFGGWVIDPSGIYFPSTFPVGYQYNTSITASLHNDVYAGLNNVVGFGANRALRGPNPFDGSGSALLTVFGTLTTNHRILSASNSASNSELGNSKLFLSNGLYADSSSYQIAFHTTSSLQVVSSSYDSYIAWPSGANYLEVRQTGDFPLSYYDFIQELLYDQPESAYPEAPSDLKSHIIKAYDVAVLGIGNVLNFPAMKVYGISEDETRLFLSASNPYGQTIKFNSAASASYYYPNTDGDYTYTQGSISAGSREFRIISGEGLRLSTSGSTLNQSDKPYLSMGQLSQSFDEVGVFLGFPSGSDDPLFSLRSKDGAYLNYTGDGVNFSGNVQGSTINGSEINGGAINIGIISGSNPIRYNFTVDSNGNVNANNAGLSGSINATDGRIGDWIIDAGTGNLRDDNSEIVFDPSLPELQFYTASEKKVIISPSNALTTTTGDVKYFEFTGSGVVYPTPQSVTTNTANANTVYSSYMVSLPSTGSYNVTAVGAIEVELNIPALSVSQPAGTSHTTSYPSYLPTFNGQFHGGYSSPSVAFAELNLEAVNISTGVVVGRTLLGTAAAVGSYNGGNYYTGEYIEEGGGGGTCLVGTSLIEMGDGSFKQIKDIKIGDFIKSLNIDSLTPKYSEENDWTATDISDSEKTIEEVLDIKSYADNEIYNINNGLIECTHSHKHIIKQNGVWCIKTTDKINVGDVFLNSENEEVEITSITINEKTDDVYNIRVSGKHTYYVNGILTHNAKGFESFFSVTGDTKIILSSGETILAEDVVEGQKILAWSWNDKLDNTEVNKFSEFEIAKIKKRKVDKVYKVSAGGKTIRVSDSHGFWLNDNKQIKTVELVAGESMINIKDGNGIKLVLVDSVEIIKTDEWVYTFSVPGVHNYVSDDIISHNDGTWTYVATSTISGYQNNVSAQTSVTRSMNLTSTGNIRFRYSIRFYGYSGQRANIGSSINSYSFTYQSHTVGPTLANTPTYDTILNVSVPSNFVEIKAGGIQVVSTPDTYVRIPRKPAGSLNQEVFKAAGGISYFEKTVGLGVDTTTAINSKGDIIPETDSLYNIGTTSNRFAGVYTDNLTGLGNQHQTNTVATSMSTNNYQKLADGSIIQWGRINSSANVTFPVTFGSPPVVTCASYRSSNGANGYNHIYNLTTSGVSLVLDSVDGYWIAVGNLPTG